VRGSKYDVRTLEHLAAIAEREDKNIAEIVVERERMLASGEGGEIGEEKILDFMRENWELMKRSIEKGMTGQNYGELTKSLAEKLATLQEEKNFENFEHIKTYAYAVAVGLVNASGGRIVSCPTAGSAGIVPAVAYSLLKEGFEEEKIVKSLFTAGMICLIVKSKASVSGAQHGCQAECGVARAMAAALETEVRGGKPYQVINAVGHALRESLGLPCDPIGGLVEVPCIWRNGACALAARNDALVALNGIETIPSPDEILEVMDNVGKDLSDKYKEGKIGEYGLAATTTAMKLMGELKRTSNRYLIPYKHLSAEY